MRDDKTMRTLEELVLSQPNGLLGDGDWIESKDQDPDGEVRLIQLADVGDGRFKDVSDRWLRKDRAQKLNCTFLAPGDILIARMGDPMGRSAIFPGFGYPCVTAVDVCIVRLGPGVDSYWLVQAINADSTRRLISDLSGGGTRQRIATRELRQLKLRVPPYAEQLRIAEILRYWDEAIEKTERLIAVKESALLGHLNDATLDAEAATLPSGWVRTTLGEVTDVALRRVEWDDKAVYRRITVRRACGGLAMRGDAVGEDILTKDMYLVKAGDFVISRRQVIHGAWAVARNEFDNTHVSKEYACLTARPDKLWMPYLDWLSRTARLRHEALRCSYGVDPEKMVLNLDWLLKSPLSLPTSVERQRKLAEFLDIAQREVTLLKSQRDALARQKRGLMQKLLTGEWPVRQSREAAA